MKKNSRTSTSSQVLEDSLLQQNGQDSGQLSSVKKRSSAKKSLKSIGQKSQLLKKSETLMGQNTEEQLFLPEVSPANLSPLLGSEEAKRMTVTSGQKCSELLVKQNPIGYLQRMCLESSAWHSIRCLLIWKGKVTPRGRLLFQLVASTPRTEGIESGLLPTMAYHSQWNYRGASKNAGTGLATAIKMLPTPQANEKNQYHSKDKGMALSRQIASLPTPQSRDWKGPSDRSNRGIEDDLPHKIEGRTGKKTGLKLQPAFVEWMMGFPIGFTDLKHSAMQSSHKSHLRF